MNTNKVIGFVLASSLACGGFCATAFAGGLGDMAGGALGGGDMSSLASGSAGNAAGVIEYCVKNNYLGGDAASSMKDKLMGKAGLGSDNKDEGYASGAGGLVKTSDGKSVDLSKLGGGAGGMAGMGGMGDMKSKLTKKACGAVLDHAKSLL
ncbi:MAG TPA: DUF2501 domain-containing protein [Rudaea sp.]|jgi:hypothetical protein